MNVRTITSLTFAITLLAAAGAIFAEEDFPYTGPDKPVITTTSNDGVVRYGRHSVYVEQGTVAAQRRGAGNDETSNDVVIRYGCDSIYVRESYEAIQATRITTDIERA